MNAISHIARQNAMQIEAKKDGRAKPGAPLIWLAEHVYFRSDNCLIWPFCKDSAGYGGVSVGGSKKGAHRIMCILAHGEAPSELHEVAHSCGNGTLGCVNPRHLRWATRSENFSDKKLHGTDNAGERHPLAKITLADAQKIRLDYGRGDVTLMGLAERFSVSEATISNIVNLKSWTGK